jgi:hypothetical protein
MKLSVALYFAAAAEAAYYSPADYASGKVHRMSMQKKESEWARHRALGDFDSWKWPSLDRSLSKNGPKYKRDFVKCKNGQAIVEQGNPNQTFACNNVSLDTLQ